MRRALLTALAAALLLGACSSPDTTGQQPTEATTAPTASPKTPGVEEFVTGLTIPWAVGGQRQFRDGTTKHEPGEWPNAAVPAIRLWDTFTTWANLEPKEGEWRFHRLDRFVEAARANGTTDITLVLAGTPRWAATKVTDTDAPWIGPGSASFPKDIEAWRTYVRTVVARYAGRITAYEIGNEPNMPMFWTGTDEQYRLLVEAAAQEITKADPAATIVAQVGLVRRPKDIPAIERRARDLSSITGIDVISVHAYPRARRLDESRDLLIRVRQAIRDSDPVDRPSWLTEVNVSRSQVLSAQEKARAVRRLNEHIRHAAFDRAYWYSWTVEGAPGLIPLNEGTAAGAALVEQLG